MSKTYIIYPKGAPELWYEIEAPTKYIAKWCGLNIIQSNFCCNYTIKDIIVERKKERRREKMNKPTYRIEVNYDEAKLLSAALVALMNKSPDLAQTMSPNADIDYIIGQIQDAMETLEE